MSEVPECLHTHPHGSMDYLKCSQAKRSVCKDSRFKLKELETNIKLKEKQKALDELETNIKLEQEMQSKALADIIEKEKEHLAKLEAIKPVEPDEVTNEKEIRQEIDKKLKQIKTIKKKAVFDRLSNGQSSVKSKK